MKVDNKNLVPLTKEILEKNCTKVEPLEDNVNDYTEYVFDEDTSVISETYMPFMFNWESADGQYIYKKIEFVHELQLLLKLVGIDKTIEL